MSSENYVRIIMAENLRFLEEGSSAQGKPGAKARRKRVVDAHTVEIPWPPKPYNVQGRRRIGKPGNGKTRSSAKPWVIGKSVTVR